MLTFHPPGISRKRYQPGIINLSTYTEQLVLGANKSCKQTLYYGCKRMKTIVRMRFCEKIFLYRLKNKSKVSLDSKLKGKKFKLQIN